MATSPRKSPSPKKSIASGSARPRKSVKSSTKGKSNDQTADESTQEKGEQTKAKKSATRKSTKAADSGKKVTQGTTAATTFKVFPRAYSLCTQPNRERRRFQGGL